MSTDVYLDVDGVLNAVCLDTPRTWGWGESTLIGCNGFGIRYSPACVERFNALAERPDVNMHWLTTWLNDAPQKLCSQIGLRGENWPVLGKAAYKDLSWTWWKLLAVQEHFPSNGNRAVWIDDDLMDSDAREWAAPHVDDGTLLLVQPLTHRALTRAEFDALEAWIGAAA